MPLTGRRSELHRTDDVSGRWFSAVCDMGASAGGRLRIEAGSTGNRIDPARRVRRRGHDLVRVGGRLELRSWWPVREVRTNEVGRFVRDTAAELDAAGSTSSADDLARLAELAEESLDVDPGDLVSQVLSSAHPLLRHPVGAGARPDEVPVPLEPLLHHPDPRSAARHALGPRVTRPLVRALAAALLPDDGGRIAWEPLLLALMAADRCGPEQLTAILSTRPHRPGAVSFSPTDVARARAMFEDVHPRRVAEDLVDALEAEGGTTELAQRLIRHDARPPAPPVDAAPRPRPARVPQAPAPEDRGARPIQYPASWTATVDAEVPGSDGCRVVLPRTGDELLEWGTHLGNCLGAYRTTAALGRTRIMGFAVGGQLRYAAEISPGRALRQLEAADNRLPMPSRERAIVDWLRQRRLVETDARRIS